MCGSQLFPEADDAADFGKAYRYVRSRADLIRNVSIGCELCASLISTPILHRGHQRVSHTVAAGIRIDEPSFEVGDTLGLTAFRVIPNRRFGKSYDVTESIECDKCLRAVLAVA